MSGEGLQVALHMRIFSAGTAQCELSLSGGGHAIRIMRSTLRNYSFADEETTAVLSKCSPQKSQLHLLCVAYPASLCGPI